MGSATLFSSSLTSTASPSIPVASATCFEAFEKPFFSLLNPRPTCKAVERRRAVKDRQ